MSKYLSIIIPVFNGAIYIESCLNSLATQNLDRVEIIVVNDGSTDSTDLIIRNKFNTYIEDGSILYISTENGGVSAARNRGLDHATGEYVAFVDADDSVSQDYISVILNAIIDSPSIIEFGFRTITAQGAVKHEKYYIHEKFGKHKASALLDTVCMACLWYPVLRVVKRDLFQDTRFPLGVHFCEDLIALYDIYKKAETVYSLSNILYTYKLNLSGATANIKPSYATQLIDYYRQIIDDNSFANKAVKVNLAYTIRRCISATTDSSGKMPIDIEEDISKLIFTPRLLYKMRFRFILFALWGPTVKKIKYLLKK